MALVATLRCFAMSVLLSVSTSQRRFSAQLLASDVDLVFCDLTPRPPRGHGTLPAEQMASVAELEAGLISERPKLLSRLQRRGAVKLGNPNGARALRGKQTGNAKALAVIKANAQGNAENLRAIMPT